MTTTTEHCPTHGRTLPRIWASVRDWLRRHPAVRDALLWAIPAIVVGAVLRAILLSYLPYAYWGSDSNSYFGFAEHLIEEGKITLQDKRRFVYPIVMLPMALLPGATLHWVAWLQHAFGLLTLVALAYCIRKSFVLWKWWVIPLTTLYAAFPIIIWYEHEMLAESLFFAAVIWTMAGWQAWAEHDAPAQRARHWWWFFVPFAVLVLTKPAGRFIWPGVVLAMLLVFGWRWIRKREAISMAAAAALMAMIGQDSQASWLLYTSAFPLTQLHTEKHAALKAEIRDLVEEARKGFEQGDVVENQVWKRFLKNPDRQTERPLWRQLAQDRNRVKVYRELALEGIFAEPFLFLKIAGQKILLSANLDDFKEARFDQDYTIEKFEHLYERYRKQSPWRVRNLFGLAKDEPLPDYAVVKTWLAPSGRQGLEAWMCAYADRFEDFVLLVDEPPEDDGPQKIAHFEATPLGWWVLAGAVLSFLPWYFRRLGVWVMIACLYLVGVFLVGGVNTRFFAAVWGVVAILLPVPLDTLFRLVRQRAGKRAV